MRWLPVQVMHEANMRKLLPKITCPALLAVGETDYRSVGYPVHSPPSGCAAQPQAVDLSCQLNCHGSGSACACDGLLL